MPMNNISFAGKAESIKFQESELKNMLSYLNTHSPFYKKLFSENSIDIHSIQTISDLNKIPVTTKDDLHGFNWDFLCVDKSKIVEYCNTSGTLGTPVTIGLTESDLQRLGHNEYLSFLNAETTSHDIFHLMLSLDRQFMAGIAYYLGARKLGAGIIRGGPGNFGMQIETISRLCPTVLIAVPSFIVSLLEYAQNRNIDLNSTTVTKIICIGENIKDENLQPNALAQRILKSWNVQLFSTYASTEQQTAFTECVQGKGGHHQPELMIFEILDDQNQPMAAGEYGELTVTTLGVEGMPLLRYKTGDICTYFDESCGCGRTTSRLGPIIGRKKQLIKYSGTTLYPQSIFNVLNSIDFIQDYVIEVSKTELGLDNLILYISLKNDIENHQQTIKHALQSGLRIVPEIQFTNESQIQKLQVQEGKRKINKFIDNR